MRTLKIDRCFYALNELPDLLWMSREDLIGQAIQGNLHLIVRVPPNSTVWSVHRDAIDIASPAQQHRRITGTAKAVRTDETFPMSMESKGITGLALTGSDCLKLLTEGCTKSSIFEHGVNSRGIWTCDVSPTPRNAFYKDRQHDVEGWVLACYPLYMPIGFLDDHGYPKPMEVDVTFDTIRVTSTSIDRFQKALLQGDITNEFFVRGENGEYLDIKNETVGSVSDRLSYLIDIVTLCWRDCPADASEKDIRDRIDAVTNQLRNEAFITLLDSNNVGERLLRAVENATTPIFARKDTTEWERETYPTFVTPELVALVTAWKVFWGRPGVDHAHPGTQPTRPEEIQFLRSFGLKEKAAEALATLLRPSLARQGRPYRPAHQPRIA